MRHFKEVVSKTFETHQIASKLKDLVNNLKSLDGEVRAIQENLSFHALIILAIIGFED